MEDLCSLIHKAGRGCYMYSMDIARAYRQLPLDPGDWPLVCFNFDGTFFADISLPFGLRWVPPTFRMDESCHHRTHSMRLVLPQLLMIYFLFWGGWGGWPTLTPRLSNILVIFRVYYLVWAFKRPLTRQLPLQPP